MWHRWGIAVPQWPQLTRIEEAIESNNRLERYSHQGCRRRDDSVGKSYTVQILFDGRSAMDVHLHLEQAVYSIFVEVDVLKRSRVACWRRCRGGSA